MKLTNLMSELVKRNGSDLHLTGDSYPFFRIQGQILPASSEQYSSKELRADLTQILGDEKLAKFDKEKELDCSYGLEGIARFRMNIFIDRGKISCVMRALLTYGMNLVKNELTTIEEVERVCLLNDTQSEEL